MSTFLATLVYAIGIMGLFYLDRDKNLHTSKALWIPVAWVWISGSRPVSLWFGPAAAPTSAELLDGSLKDRLIFSILIAGGLLVLLFRSRTVAPLLKKNWPVLLFFSYCLLSVMWSDFPEVAAKRWVKALGDLVMVLVVVSDAQPTAAVRRLITRTGFFLLPVSILLIKYYPNLGRTFDTWTGEPANCGVGYTKNMLGVLTFVLSLGAVWLVVRLIGDKSQPNRTRHFIAQGTLLAFGVWLLSLAHSATSGICFTLGTLLILVTSPKRFRERPNAIHVLVLSILVIVGCAVFFGDKTVAHAVGRKTDLTGRTEIWETVIPMVPNSIVGAGFDSFWLGPRLQLMWNLYPNLYLNEAHNGYIQTYLDLGVIGVLLIALLLLNGYWNAVKAFHNGEAFGTQSLMLAYIFTAAFYSITEAGFREMFVIWIFLLMAIVASSQMSKVFAKSQTSQTNALNGKMERRRRLLSTTSQHG